MLEDQAPPTSLIGLFLSPAGLCIGEILLLSGSAAQLSSMRVMLFSQAIQCQAKSVRLVMLGPWETANRERVAADFRATGNMVNIPLIQVVDRSSASS